MFFVFDFMQGLAEDLRTAHVLSMVTGVLNSLMYSAAKGQLIIASEGHKVLCNNFRNSLL